MKHIKKNISFLLLIILLIPFVSSNVWKNILIADDTVGEDDATGIYAIDLNADGYMDFVGGINVNDQIRWYKNQGNDTYLNYTVADVDGVTYIEVGDFNNNGIIDIVSVANPDGLQIHINNGDEVFSTSTIDTTATNSLDIIDFDNDGDIDIISGTTIEDTVLLWVNNGFAEFTKVVIASGIDQVNDVKAIDIDRDGDLDILVVAGGVVSETVWFENDGSHTFFTEHSIDITANSFSADGNDLDDDGDIDIVILTTNSVFLYINDGTQTFTKNVLTASISSMGKIIIIDIDNDNDNDIIYTSESLNYFENDNNNKFINKTIYNPSSIMKGLFIGYIDEDTALDIAVGDTVGNEFRWFKNLFALLSCEYPSIFCDDFNYVASMNTRGWSVEIGTDIDSTYTPINNKLDLSIDDNSIITRHNTELFQTSYKLSASDIFTSHYYSPVFSSQFVLYFENSTNNIFEYQADQKYLQTGYVIRTEIDLTGNSSGNMNWYYLNETNPNFVYVLICGNCTFSDTNLDIKISSFFKQRDNFPFNSTISTDIIKLYSNGDLLGEIDNFLFGDTIERLSRYHITKYNVGNFTIDNYYVMIGTDKNVATIENYYTDFFINITSTIDSGVGDEDLTNRIANFWVSVGLKSSSSRYIFGLFVLSIILISIAYEIASLGGGMASAIITGLAGLILIFLFTYIDLLPKWIIIIITIIAVAFFLVAFKNIVFQE